MTDPYTRLIQMVQLRNKMHVIARKMHAIQREIDALSAEEKQRNVVRDQKQHEIRELKKKRDALEQHAQDATDKMRQKQAAIARVKTDREREALEHEYAQLDATREQYEHEAFTLWDTIADAEADCATYAAELEKMHHEHTETRTHKQQELAAEQEAYTTLSSQHAAVRSELPDEWRTWYDQLQERSENPFVFLSGSHCPVCGSAIPRADQGRVARHVIVYCHGCHRVLLAAD